MITVLFLFFFFLKISTFQNLLLSGSLEMVWRLYFCCGNDLIYIVRLFLFSVHSSSLPLRVAYLRSFPKPRLWYNIQARLRFDSQPHPSPSLDQASVQEGVSRTPGTLPTFAIRFSRRMDEMDFKHCRPQSQSYKGIYCIWCHEPCFN